MLACLWLHRRPKSQKPSRGTCHRAAAALAAKGMAALAKAGRAAREPSVCRECGHPARLLWSVCPHCGAGNPVRIDISPSVVITGVGSELSILLLQFI